MKKKTERLEDATLLVLKMKNGATSQEMQEASKKLENTRK